jgi:hypothetical protein
LISCLRIPLHDDASGGTVSARHVQTISNDVGYVFLQLVLSLAYSYIIV